MPTKQEKQVPKTKEQSVATHVAKGVQPWMLVLAGALITAGLGALAFTSYAYVVAARQKQTVPTVGFDSGEFQPRRGGMHRMEGDGYSTQVVAVQGVITSIKGKTITVAGQGKKTTVKKTDSTVIGGDKDTLAVNDSVAVIGSTASDGTVTATRILVQNGTDGSFSASISWGSQADIVPGA